MSSLTAVENAPRYGFYGRLKSAFPSQVIIDTTEICNLACVHCPHPEFKKSVHYSARSLEVELNAKVIDEIRDFGKGSVQYVRYTGEGEPMLHRQFFTLLGYAVKNAGTTVSLTTNGSLMDQAKIDGLLEMGVHVIDISIDAFKPETYAKIRVNGDLEVTRGNVLKLLASVKKLGSAAKTKVVVSFIEQPDNLDEAKDFESFWKANGADYVVVRRLHSGAGAVSTVANVLQQKNTQEARRPCLYPWERIVLNPRGELVFCPQDWVHGATICDYRNTTIHEVWQGEYYRKLREAHLTNSYANHSFCDKCPDWSATRWPDEGRSYADMIQDFKSRE